MADLDGVAQHVLAVAGAVTHAAQELDQLRMDAVQVGLKDGLFAGLADLVVHFLAGLLHHLLDAGGVDAAVGDQLLQGDAGDLAAHRIEGGDDHGLGGVVDDEIHARGGLQRADVAALAADDAALHVVVGQRNHGHGGLGHVIRRALLDGGGDDVAGLLVRLLLGAGFNLAHHDGGVVVGVLLDAVDQDVLGFVAGHVGHALQLLLLAVVHLLGLGLQALGLAVLVVELLLALLQVVHLLVELFLALVDPALLAGHLAAAVADLLVELILQANDLLLGLQHRFLLLVLSLAGRLVQQVPGVLLRLADLLLHRVLAVEVSGCEAGHQRNQRNDSSDCNIHVFPSSHSNFRFSHSLQAKAVRTADMTCASLLCKKSGRQNRAKKAPPCRSEEEIDFPF